MRTRTRTSLAAATALTATTLLTTPALGAQGDGNGVRVPLVVPGTVVVATAPMEGRSLALWKGPSCGTTRSTGTATSSRRCSTWSTR